MVLLVQLMEVAGRRRKRETYVALWGDEFTGIVRVMANLPDFVHNREGNVAAAWPSDESHHEYGTINQG